MSSQPRPIQYLLVGHVAKDLAPAGQTLGGTVAYAGLTATALGAHVGIVTACAADLDLQPLMDLDLVTHPSNSTTTFVNSESSAGRSQSIRARAEQLTFEMIPSTWRTPSIMHLAPIADEIDTDMLNDIHSSSVYLTPQGWMRTWDTGGQVKRKHWTNIIPMLASSRAVVCSSEDLGDDPHAPAEIAREVKVLAVTRGKHGAILFVEGQRYEIPGVAAEEIDATGSGDIFAAAFFMELNSGQDPRRAAMFANQLAAQSVTRRGLNAVPTMNEIEAARGIP